MMNASAKTTKTIVASLIAFIKQGRYYNHTGYKTIVFKCIPIERNSKKTFSATNPGEGCAGLSLIIRH